ncbi:RNA polymerase II-associated protein 3-like [Sorex fumeus]|uniref:RNA polymerase II-associated protein 3-like n=1 Tax=Sorex fumeus TaxID=62283 RepID=UPI0024ACFF1D|nr:RNA polymerase II-associated protein 3-like [Sorex fumeus]
MTSTSKAIELQLQVKQNTEELQDFMRDLEHWEKDIKQKDMELRRQNGVPEEDSVLDELDKEDSTRDSVSPESESEEDGIHVDSQTALALKEKGNKYFKQGKYDDAIECYTKGMHADPYNPVLPTNRASAYFRLKK